MTRWYVLAVLFLVRMAMAFQFGAIAPVAPIVEHRFGVDLADIGFLIGLYFVPGIAIAVPGGTISALVGDRRAVAAGVVLMLAGSMLAVFADTWPVLIGSRLLAGVGGVLINVLMTKLVADWFVGREISTAMAIYVNSWPVGIALALLILPLMTARWSLPLAWAIIPVLISGGLLLFLAVYRAPPGLRQAPRLGIATRIPFTLVILAGAVWALFNCAIVMVFSFSLIPAFRERFERPKRIVGLCSGFEKNRDSPGRIAMLRSQPWGVA